MIPGYEVLEVLNISRIMDALQDVRDLPQELQFVNRTDFRPAMEGEIMGRWISRALIADLIADDQKAHTYSSGKVQVENTLVPNIKQGRHLTQENINVLGSIASNPGLGSTQGMGPNEIVDNVLGSMVEDIWEGLYNRCEALIVAMHLDSWSYNRMGIQVQGSWGIPADLKVTPQYPWTDPVNGTPVNDVWTLKRNASVRYGMMYNRMWMSTSAFMYMISTNEFQAKARTTLPLFINYTNIPQADLNFQRNIATNVLGLDELRLYDARFWSQSASGEQTSAPFLPINKVILDSTTNDNNTAVQDFANAVVTESMLSSLLPNSGTGVIGRFGAGMRGPVAYTTVPVDMNPPNMTVWGVMRGFPRRFRFQANAVLTVGAFSDQIPPIELF